jgi:hypothetical protein
VKRILNKYGYPLDLLEAVKTVLTQAELLCADWVRARLSKPIIRLVSTRGIGRSW